MSGQPPQAPDDGLGSYVYAVVDAGTSLPDGLDGLDGAPLRTVVCGEVAAVVADVRARLAPTVSLYVNSYNTAALATYGRVGFRQVGTYATVLF